jgi:hypothetical protein
MDSMIFSEEAMAQALSNQMRSKMTNWRKDIRDILRLPSIRLMRGFDDAISFRSENRR